MKYKNTVLFWNQLKNYRIVGANAKRDYLESPGFITKSWGHLVGRAYNCWLTFLFNLRFHYITKGLETSLTLILKMVNIYKHALRSMISIILLNLFLFSSHACQIRVLGREINNKHTILATTSPKLCFCGSCLLDVFALNNG